jgi:hypothetical protein
MFKEVEQKNNFHLRIEVSEKKYKGQGGFTLVQKFVFVYIYVF